MSGKEVVTQIKCLYKYLIISNNKNTIQFF